MNLKNKPLPRKYLEIKVYKIFKNYINRIVLFLTQKYYSLIYKNLTIRKNTTDNNIFKDIFIKKELKLPIKIKPKLIIDGGAYTGLSTLYFASQYPEAQIYAIEPENSNFTLLEKHINKYKNIHGIKAALWSQDTFLKIRDRQTGHWGFYVQEVEENDNPDTKAITIDTILKISGLEKIDILKLDIECAEKELFSKNYQPWLNKVEIIIIELHDFLEPGCNKAFYSAINLKEWTKYKRGEKRIFVRKK